MVSRSRNPNKKTNIPLVIQPDVRKKIKARQFSMEKLFKYCQYTRNILALRTIY